MKTPRRVIIWGYPLHTHTHSYIHYGYFRAFSSLGYETYWVDNLPCSPHELEDSLIITEHFATSCLPLVKSSTYFVHYLGNKNNNESKYLGSVGRLVDMRYNADCWVDKNYDYSLDRSKVHKVSDGTYFETGSNYDSCYTTWATDLLPHEIDLDKRFMKREDTVFYIGTVGGGRGGLFDCQKAPDYYDTVPYIMPFYNECIKNGVNFVTNDPWTNPLSNEQARSLVEKSFLAPDFRHKAMLDWGYIPCRVLKNISYGHLGLTNSQAVKNFLGDDVLYSADSSELFHLGRSSSTDYELIKKSMIRVRDEHTYVNRAKDVLWIYGQ